MNQNNNENLAVSFLTIRRTIGVLGITLPFILVLLSFVFGDCGEIQRSDCPG